MCSGGVGEGNSGATTIIPASVVVMTVSRKSEECSSHSRGVIEPEVRDVLPRGITRFGILSIDSDMPPHYTSKARVGDSGSSL